LLLLDEPTSGLDPVLRRDLYTVVESCRDAGATVLISTHALAEIEGRTDRIAVLSNGRLVAVGTLEELRRETGLPVAIRVTTVTGRAGALANDLHDAQLQKVNESSVSLSCSESEKLQIVARITSRPEWVRDVEIVRPGLEEIYACFVGDGRPR
jgi:Cu-processing system ATP-binding protein